MAELAAGAVVAEQVVSTGIEAGVAVSIAKPTQPLKATLSQIATTPAHDSTLALARSHHTVTVVDNKAYIFGGTHAPQALCTTDIHAISLPTMATATTTTTTSPSNTVEYACYPAFPLKDTTTGTLLVPSPRQSHAACATRPNNNSHLVIHGGSDAHNTPIDEQACLWLFDIDTLRWSKRIPAPDSTCPAPRAGHFLFSCTTASAATTTDQDDAANTHDTILLYGGGQGDHSRETWTFDLATARWTKLPSSPSTPASAAFVDGALYSISSDTTTNPAAIHVLRLPGPNDVAAWETIDLPHAPRPRIGGALVSLSTGYGRHYLAYLFGRYPASTTAANADDATAHPLSSDIWALQIPSRNYSAAAVKDVIRDKVLPKSVESGAYRWAEVEIVPTEQVAREGKVHPGPRAFVGASGCLAGKGVVFWGGENAGGERESDGWLLKIQ